MTGRFITDQDIPLQNFCQVSNSGGKIDRIPDESIGKPVIAARVAGEHRTGVDTDSMPERRLSKQGPLLVQFFQVLSHVEGCVHGPVRMVAELQRHTENRLYLITDILKDQSVVIPNRG